MTSRRRVVSGIRTSGELHLGNYLGALRRFIDMQDEHECYFFLADLHGLTTTKNADELRGYVRHTAEIYIACGLDPDKVTFFRQSDISAHAEMAWLLTTQATMGEFSRMTQYKDKSQGQAGDSIGVGLFTYPALMAADILLYTPELVPVGEDQKQHVEITRDLGERFNHRFGDILRIPQPMIEKESARIKSLDDPTKKMSKSAASSASYIALADGPDAIRRKVMRAVTDSGSVVKAGPTNPGLTNLLNIYSVLSDRPVAELEQEYAGKGYGDLKKDLAEVIVEVLAPIRRRLQELADDPGYIVGVLEQGAAKARPVAEQTLEDAKRGVGLL